MAIQIEFVEAPQKFFEIFGRRYDHSSCRSLMKVNKGISLHRGLFMLFLAFLFCNLVSWYMII